MVAILIYIPTNHMRESFPFSMSSHCKPLFLLLFFLMIAILTRVKYLIVVLICISLLINNVDHFFIHSLVNLDFFFHFF
jgi:hypothetical protein